MSVPRNNTLIVLSDDEEPQNEEYSKNRSSFSRSKSGLSTPPIASPDATNTTPPNNQLPNPAASAQSFAPEGESSDDSIVIISDVENDDATPGSGEDEPSERPRSNLRARILGDDSDDDVIIDSDDEQSAPVQEAQSPGAGPQQVPPAPNAPSSEVDDPMDVDSDDEIAVLSKEEAERIGSFKKTSFEAAPPREVLPRPQPGFNQPAPVYHAGEHAVDPATAAQDLSIRNYFEPFSLPELQQHENNLGRQLSGLTATRDSVLNAISELRSQVSNLGFDNVSMRGQLMRAISEKLDSAEDAIQRSKKVRQYLSILSSVKDMKMFPEKYMQQTGAYGNPGPSANQYGPNLTQMPGSFPGQHATGYGPYAQPTGVFSQYSAGMPPGPGFNNPAFSGQNAFNPYMTAAAPDPDRVHLEQLFNDISKEEDVKGMAPTPDTLVCQLFDHQRQGLNWLLKKEQANSGCMLADDMGLGKTVQTLALLVANKSTDASCKTTLIVGPVSLLRQWDAEIRKKIKSNHALKTCLYIGNNRKKNSSFRHLKRYDVVLVSYSTLASEFKQHFAQVLEEAMVSKNQNVLPDLDSGGRSYRSPFYSKDANFYRIVLDEAQSIKNKLSLTSKSVACLKAIHRLCLTGTPMQNNIDELYPVLRFLRSKPYDDEKKFKKDISVPLKSNNEQVDDYEINQSMKKLRAVLSAIMLRRTKNSKVDGKPLLQLPKKEILLVYVTMEKEENEFYADLEKGIQKQARKMMETSQQSGNFLVLLLRLRQACIHQILVEVGQYSEEEKWKATNWLRMYELIQDMSREAKRNVASVLEDAPKISEPEIMAAEDSIEIVESDDEPSKGGEASLTCPMCFDVATEDNIVVLSVCGHTICDGCIDNFFGQSEDGGETAPCMICKTRISTQQLIDYTVFSKVVYEGWDESRMSANAASSRKLTPSQKFAAVLGPEKKFPLSAKLGKALELVQKITSDTPDEKIIVFSHFVITFDLLQLLFQRKGIKYLRYDGSMNIDEKNAAISSFYDGPSRVLLISLKAGNVGLTLTCANHVILMDPFWNPYVEEQAMDRAHRLGQERPVKVYRLLIKNSVEDRITELQQSKRNLIGSAMDENALKSSSSLGRRELGYLFGLNSLE